MAKEKRIVTSEPVENFNQLDKNKLTSPNLKSQNATTSLKIEKPMERMIYTIRNEQVMIDFDLAVLYGVENRSLRQSVRRNIDKFPEDFLFRLTPKEANELILKGVSQNVIPPGYNTGGADMLAFTEHGVAMLASILKSPNAKEISIAIIRTFVAMRHFILSNAQLFQRIDRIEYRQLETDQKIEQVFAKLAEKSISPKQGIFFDGQIYDAYEFVCGLIKRAKTRIILIDNYVDDTVLTMLDKRDAGVSATIYTQKISPQFQLDVAKHNAQYQTIDVKEFTKSHDRFLILDNQVYLIGASLKDLGKKWFAVALMSETNPKLLLDRL